MNPSGRTGIDPGLDNTRKWLDDWCGDSCGLTIRAINIPLISKYQEVVTDDPVYLAASTGKQTPLHVYLKYNAYRWLCALPNATVPAFEVRMYFPDSEFLDRVSVRTKGSRFDIHKAQVIQRGNTDVVATFGSLIVVDVFTPGTSLEVGYTRPFNLLSPVVEGLTDRAIWVPFPLGTTQDMAGDFPSSEITGYEIMVLR